MARCLVAVEMPSCSVLGCHPRSTADGTSELRRHDGVLWQWAGSCPVVVGCAGAAPESAACDARRSLRRLDRVGCHGMHLRFPLRAGTERLARRAGDCRRGSSSLALSWVIDPSYYYHSAMPRKQESPMMRLLKKPFFPILPSPPTVIPSLMTTQKRLRARPPAYLLA